jgi:hypothetical protein
MIDYEFTRTAGLGRMNTGVPHMAAAGSNPSPY